jgi:hypothetical protein
MIYGVLAEIDYVYHNYEIALFMNEGSFKVATDVLQLGLGVASTITNGARSKTVLSAVLTGVTGTSLHAVCHAGYQSESDSPSHRANCGRRACSLSSWRPRSSRRSGKRCIRTLKAGGTDSRTVRRQCCLGRCIVRAIADWKPTDTVPGQRQIRNRARSGLIPDVPVEPLTCW